MPTCTTAPAVSPQSVAINAAALALVLGVVDPAVAATGQVALLAAPIVITLAIPTPTLVAAGQADILAAPVVMTLVVPTPTVSSSIVMLIAPVIMAFVMPTPRVLLGPRIIVYRPFMKWPPVLTVSPNDIARGQRPRLVRRPDGSYVETRD